MAVTMGERDVKLDVKEKSRLEILQNLFEFDLWLCEEGQVPGLGPDGGRHGGVLHRPGEEVGWRTVLHGVWLQGLAEMKKMSNLGEY